MYVVVAVDLYLKLVWRCNTWVDASLQLELAKIALRCSSIHP